MNKGKNFNQEDLVEINKNSVINAEAELLRLFEDEINKSIIKGIEEEAYKEKLRTIKNRFDQNENNDNNL